MTRRLVFLDCETDGLDPVTRQPWEIGMIIRTEDGDVEHSYLVDLDDYSTSDPKALSIGRFGERHPRGRALAHMKPLWPKPLMFSEQEATQWVYEQTAGAQIIGAQPSFDTITLETLLRKHGFTPGWYHRLRDVESMTAGRLRQESGGLQDCARLLGIPSPPKDQHTALGDANLAMRIYDLLINDDREEDQARREEDQVRQELLRFVGHRVRVLGPGRILRTSGLVAAIVLDVNPVTTTRTWSVAFSDGIRVALGPGVHMEFDR